MRAIARILATSLRAAVRLGWDDIAVSEIPLDRIILGEYAANALRKDFTPIERLAILDSIERMRSGYNAPEKSPDRATTDKAVKLAGFSSRDAAYLGAGQSNSRPRGRPGGPLPRRGRGCRLQRAFVDGCRGLAASRHSPGPCR